MGSLERRLRRLEARAEAVESTEVDPEVREFRTVLRYLDTEDLRALDALLTDFSEHGNHGEMDLYDLADECARRALEAYARISEALTRGEEPPPRSSEA